jgi:translation initiation factor IF-2
MGKKNKNFKSNNSWGDKSKSHYSNPGASKPHIEGDKYIYEGNITIEKLASDLGLRPNDILKTLFMKGKMLNINSVLSDEDIAEICIEHNLDFEKKVTVSAAEFEKYEIVDDEKDLVERPPVVTIMGHVDHGKTTLIDTIRDSHIAEGEAGAITQEIGAYQKTIKGKKITFLDTPGHEAFSAMRKRGAQATDIVVLVVAADDGVMPQTKEAIDHAKAAGVPIIVAVNKIDKPGANPEKVKAELSSYGLVSEEWGGDTIMKEISAKKKIGIDDLLDNILLLAELKELKANPSREARGLVIEATMDKKVGAKATLLVKSGSLHVGDCLVVGKNYCKVRRMTNEFNKAVNIATPSTPVSVTGLDGVPEAGEQFCAFSSEKEARSIAEKRQADLKTRDVAVKPVSLDDLFAAIQGGTKEINVVLKCDVRGSEEAVKNSLEKIDVEGVKCKVIRSGIGTITESDITLAQASNAIIIGFNVVPTNSIKDYAKNANVELRLYTIIYKVVEDMEAAMKGMLDPVYEEKVIGTAKILELFKFSKVGTIAGSRVTDGVIKAGAKVRVIRDGVIIYDGKIGSLQREKDSVKEVKKGYECGITIENFNDIKEGDIIEAYELVEVKK